MKVTNNKKGFTLIELLAAVVILGILMLVAIPRISDYINNARRDTYIDTAKAYIQAARTAIANGEFVCQNNDIINFNDLSVDKGTTSSFNNQIYKSGSYVMINFDANGNYVYSVYMTDEKKAIAENETYANSPHAGDEYHAIPEEDIARDKIYSVDSSASTANTSCQKAENSN